MKNIYILAGTLFTLPLFAASANAAHESSAAANGDFSSECDETGASPGYNNDCKEAVIEVAAKACSAKPKSVSIAKVTLIGTTKNAAGGCNPTYAVAAVVPGKDCNGASDVLVKVEATRGGCFVK